MTIADKIKSLRFENAMSQAKLAKELNVSKSTVGLWETGDTLPSAKAVREMAEIFGVSADYILSLSDKKEHDISISEYTGLTEKAIETIRKLDDEALAGLNSLLHWLA